MYLCVQYLSEWIELLFASIMNELSRNEWISWTCWTRSLSVSGKSDLMEKKRKWKRKWKWMASWMKSMWVCVCVPHCIKGGPFSCIADWRKPVECDPESAYSHSYAFSGHCLSHLPACLQCTRYCKEMFCDELVLSLIFSLSNMLTFPVPACSHGALNAAFCAIGGLALLHHSDLCHTGPLMSHY